MIPASKWIAAARYLSYVKCRAVIVKTFILYKRETYEPSYYTVTIKGETYGRLLSKNMQFPHRVIVFVYAFVVDNLAPPIDGTARKLYSIDRD